MRDGRWQLSSHVRNGHPVVHRRFADGRRERRSLDEFTAAQAAEASVWCERENARQERPEYAATLAARERTWLEVSDAFQERCAVRLRKGEIQPSTYDFLAGIAERIARYWVKLRLSELGAPACERLKAAMRADKLSESTISKSFVQVIRPALAEERRLGNFALDPYLICGDVDPKYVPRTRYATPEQAWKMVRRLERRGKPTERSRHVAWFFGTGGRDAESERARWEDRQVRQVDERRVEVVRIRGTKTEKSDRSYPVTRAVEAFIRYAFADSDGKTGPMFPTEWANMRRAFRTHGAWSGAGRLSPNDLRRSTISWLCWAGIPEATVAGWLGNSAQLVRQVYRQHTPETRADAAARSALEFVSGIPAVPPSPGGATVISLAARRAKGRVAK